MCGGRTCGQRGGCVWWPLSLASDVRQPALLRRTAVGQRKHGAMPTNSIVSDYGRSLAFESGPREAVRVCDRLGK